MLDSPNVHVFHAHNHIIILVQKRAVKCHNVVGMAAVHNLQLSHDPFAHLSFRLDVYDLHKLGT